MYHQAGFSFIFLMGKYLLSMIRIQPIKQPNKLDLEQPMKPRGHFIFENLS